MTWFTIYGALGVAAAAAVFLAAEWFRDPGVPAPDHPGWIAVVSGLLWPVLLIGLAQWSVLAALGSRRDEPAPMRRHPVGSNGGPRLP